MRRFRLRIAPFVLAAALLAVAQFALVVPAWALSKAEIFARAAPATLLLVVMTPQGVEIGSGVVVDAKGLAITNYHVIRAASRARLFAAFLYDPKERAIEEDLGKYLDTHADKALQPRILRVDAENDLALLQLPPRQGGYPTVQWGDSDAVAVGQDVVAIGNPQGLAWTLTSGSISAIRKNALQTETAINPGNSGGPLLDADAKLIGINTYIRKDAQSLGFARPVNLVRSFTEGKGGLGHALAGQRPEAQAPASGEAMHAMVRAFLQIFGQKLPGIEGRRQVVQMLSALTWNGKASLAGLQDVGWLNQSIVQALESVPEGERQRLSEYVARNFPLVAAAKDGHLWVRSGTRYFDVGPAVAWDVDDVTGTVFATDTQRRVFQYQASSGKWLDTGLRDARDIEASDGTLYVLTTSGAVKAVRGKQARELNDRQIKGSLLATGGMLYVLDDGGSLFRLRGGAWDAQGRPIATGVRAVQAAGGTWYGLDGQGHVYSGQLGTYIDREGDLAGIFLLGRDLLALGNDGSLFLWNASARKWRALAE